MTMDDSTVTINVTLSEDAAMQLAHFCKHAGFNLCHNITEPRLLDSERKCRADKMVEGILAVQLALSQAGFIPR